MGGFEGKGAPRTHQGLIGSPYRPIRDRTHRQAQTSCPQAEPRAANFSPRVMVVLTYQSRVHLPS